MNVKHGKANTRIHGIWHGMVWRCKGTRECDKRNYADRGITVCEEWQGTQGFINFYNWSMQNGYADDLSIDRIDNNKGYSPDNCRWANNSTQQNNKRNNHREMVNGELISMREASNKYGISYSILRGRVYSGMTMQEAIYFEEKKNMKITIDGETKTLREWCEIYGNNRSTVWTRISRGWNPERAIKTTENVRGKTNLYSTPFVSKYQITINGVTKSLADWCRETGVNPRVARRRININHWNPADAVTIKPKYGLKYEKVAIWGNSQDNQK